MLTKALNSAINFKKLLKIVEKFKILQK